MMIAKYLSDLWTSVAPAVGNHLWQSTLFAIVAGLLTLMLRKNQARTRYWIWMAASLNFLIPFSLLIAVGGRLGWLRASDGIETGVPIAIDEFSRPFTQPSMQVTSHAASTISSTLAGVLHLLPAFLVALWLCGLIVVFFTWIARWRRISEFMRGAKPMREGREVRALRRLERKGGITTRIEIFLLRASLEPGIFGIARPILVWPEGISALLDDAHVEAILAHEIGHVRRRDNLFASIHMLVEAIFWFHPLVWFLGTRLVEEREVACDEEVLELGSERQVYAESILKICEFCVGSPLACVSGVTGADLKKRIVRIMTGDSMRKLKIGKKLLLGGAALASIVVPVAFGLAHAAPGRARAHSQNPAANVPEFRYEVASIKPTESSPGEHHSRGAEDGFRSTNVSLMQMIRQAYLLQFGPGSDDDGRVWEGRSGWSLTVTMLKRKWRSRSLTR